jgi:hypothetical protein
MPIGIPDLIPLVEVFAAEEGDPTGFLSLGLGRRLAHGETRNGERKREL